MNQLVKISKKTAQKTPSIYHWFFLTQKKKKRNYIEITLIKPRKENENLERKKIKQNSKDKTDKNYICIGKIPQSNISPIMMKNKYDVYKLQIRRISQTKKEETA